MMRLVTAATLLCALQCVHGFAAGPVVDALGDGLSWATLAVLAVA